MNWTLGLSLAVVVSVVFSLTALNPVAPEGETRGAPQLRLSKHPPEEGLALLQAPGNFLATVDRRIYLTLELGAERFHEA